MEVTGKTGWLGRDAPDIGDMIRALGSRADDAIRDARLQVAATCGPAERVLRAFGKGMSDATRGVAVLAAELRAARRIWLRGAYKRRQRAHWYRLVTRPNHDERRRLRSKKKVPA